MKERNERPSRSQQESSPPTTASSAIAPTGAAPGVPVSKVSDGDFVEQTRHQWKRGDWDGLASMDLFALEQHPDRAKLALLAAAGHLNLGRLDAARRIARTALSWGGSRQLLTHILTRAVHHSLERIATLNGNDQRALSHSQNALFSNNMGLELTLPSPIIPKMASTPDRTEILRQRKIIADLRELVNSLRGSKAIDDEAHSLITKILKAKLTYLSERKMESITKTCRAIEEQKLPGNFIEVGCALGGSAILIASLKNPVRPLSVYDVFGMIPPPSEEDTPDVHARYKDIVGGTSTGIDGDRYYGYELDLYEKVKENFNKFGIELEKNNVSLVKGLIQETLTNDKPVAFAHIDVDWYEPVSVCLERIFPKLTIGGSIIIDDYHDWGGCKKAVDNYLKNVEGTFVIDDSARSMKITKLTNSPTPK